MTRLELLTYLEHENYKLRVNMESKIIKEVSLYTSCQVISSIDDSVQSSAGTIQKHFILRFHFCFFNQNTFLFYFYMKLVNYLAELE